MMWGASQSWEGVTIFAYNHQGAGYTLFGNKLCWSLVSVCVCIYNEFSKFTSLAKVFGVEYIMRLKSTMGVSVTWKYPMDYP